MGDSFRSKSVKTTTHLDPKHFRFSVFSTDEILRLSVSKIVTPFTFDELGNPLPGGLYDSAMGVYPGSGNPCATCLSMTQCSGHVGHIQLCMTVYNPVFIQTVFKVLRLACLSCFKLQITDYRISILQLQLKLIDAGYTVEAEELEICKFESIWSESDGVTILDHPRVMEYTKLLENKSSDVVSKTRCNEAARIAIINSTLVDPKKVNCIHCKEKIKKIKYSYKRIVMTYSKDDMQKYYEETGQDLQGEKKAGSTNKVILASECRKYFRHLYANESELLKYLFPVLKHCSPRADSPVDLFFTDVVPVTPPMVRPANKVANRILEHSQTTMYKSILNANTTLRAIVVKLKQAEIEALDVEEIRADESINVSNETKAVFESTKGNTPHEKMYNAWQELQRCVDASLDMPPDKTNPGIGLKQILEKKEGIIRMNMMGKRVNHAARTVITPDPNINVDEIGVPDVFAKKLSYPTPVTPWNISEVRKMVLNGPDVHPGANFIEDARGNRRLIPGDDEVKRASMAKLLSPPNEDGATTVHRHLLNGDVLLLNRQPTLHRPSIMAHKARILAGEKTFRLHYSNCKSYNADFDGDEMNAHFPQTEVGRSEAYNLVNVANQYLVPKDGTPLGGLIQDHVISGVRLSIRGKFFNREDYQQLVYVALADKRGNIELLPPTILKPFKLWSGKQILSTIIRNIIPKDVENINLTSSSKINAKAWVVNTPRPAEAGGTPLIGNDMTEADVIIRNGELLVGILDKNHYGAAPYSLIHCMYELYGGACSTHLLTAFAKVFTIYLQRQGFTLGVRDILVVPEAEKKRTKIIKKCRKIGHATAAAALGLPDDVSAEELAEKTDEAYATNPKFRTILDRTFKSALDGFTNRINKVCLPSGLLCKFPENNLQLMVTSGAKGSTVNTMQISCLLGQIELEGKRPPLMISGKSLPSFAKFETSPKSGGFIDGRFMTGIQPQDFFFHCMAGREGLIDTAVKTSRSGYLQRCLIKHLEGLNVHYDMTVRDSDGSVVQFMYGEDGVDIEKSQFLNAKQLRFIDENTNAILNVSHLERLKDDEGHQKIASHLKKLKSWRKKYIDTSKTRHMSSFGQFSREVKDEIEVTDPTKFSKKTGRLRIDQKIIKLWNKADVEMKERYNKKFQNCPDPVNSKFRPDTNYGSVSEYTQNLIASYVKDHPKRKHDITEAIFLKSMNALIEPGAPVGLLAAQSIGEPSTQMTLNTFHFAGRGEMNVTLGIPRLREILMMAAVNIKTPSMDIPFKPQPNLEANAEKLRLKLTKTTISDVLETIDVKTRLVLYPTRARQYVLRFNFLPRAAYKNNFPVTPKQIVKYMSKTFFKNMFRAILRAGKDKHSVVDIDEPTTKKRKAGDGNNEEDESDRRADEKEAAPADNDESDNDAADDEDDATDVRLKKKRLDENDYDEPQIEEEIKEIDEDDDLNEIDPLAEKDQDDDLIDQEDVNKVVAEHDMAENYTYDKENHQWCELTFNLNMMLKNIDLSTVLKQLAGKAVIAEVPRINRAITYMNNNELVLKTEGINIAEMFKFNKLLDLNRLYTNDIHAVARTYGIEAANRVIVKEVQNVFKVYGITVDPRHLLLIADYMTFDGSIKPMNRFGMQTNASPLQQMSFESSLVFLKLAAVHGLVDNLDSPSSRLMVGQPCRGGTGAFSLMYNLNRTGIIN